MRKDALVNGQVYHIISRSIAGYRIFSDDNCFSRMLNAIRFYNFPGTKISYSKFLLQSPKSQTELLESLQESQCSNIVSYVLMPTHIHLTLQQLIEGGISKSMNNMLNSYSRYFNIRFKRKGPLWETRFKSILVESDEQLLHLTRYQHLNPTSAGLVDKTEEWKWSSYNEYINNNDANRICNFTDLLDIDPKEYQKFVNDRVAYQKEISKIKHLLSEDYTG